MQRAALSLLLCALLLAGCNTGEPVSMSVDEEREAYDTLFALSEALGFTVHSLYTLPMGYRETGIERIGPVALTTYTDEATGANIYLYMAEGVVDLSPVPVYAPAEERYGFARGEWRIEAHGDTELVYAAAWAESGYSYCLYAEAGADPLIFRKMLEDIK